MSRGCGRLIATVAYPTASDAGRTAASPQSDRASLRPRPGCRENYCPWSETRVMSWQCLTDDPKISAVLFALASPGEKAGTTKWERKDLCPLWHGPPARGCTAETAVPRLESRSCSAFPLRKVGLVPFPVAQFRANRSGWHGQGPTREGRALPVLARLQGPARADSAFTLPSRSRSLSLRLPMPPRLGRETL